MGMDSRAQPGTALLPIPWVSRAPSPLPVSQGRQEEPGMSGDTASAASSLQTPGCFLPSPQLPTPLPPVPTATSRSLPLPTLPATHSGHTRHG